MVKNLLSRNSFYVFWAAGPVLFAALYVLSRYNYLLFHSFIELFAVAIALSVFTVAWNTRHLAADNRLFLLAAAYLSIGVIDTVHTLAYSGMGVFPDRGSDLATQLWIAARYVESLSFLAAALLFRTGRSFNDKMILAGYLVLTAVLLVMIIVLQYFPSMYVEGLGLTGAKVASEYVICAILAAAGYLFWAGRKQIGRLHMQFLLAAIGATIASELSFTLYTDVYGFFNFLGHFFKLLSFWFIYKALVAGLLKDPFESLFLEVVESRDRLRESESSLSAVFEQTIQLMGIIALDGTVVRANRTALEMLGANEKDVEGKPFRECPWWTHSRDLQEKLRRSMEKAKQGESVRFEAVHIAADGQERVVDFSINPIYDDNGRVQCLLAESRDVTGSRQAEQALKQSEEKYRTVLESMEEGYFEVDLAGNYTFYNAAMCNILGYPDEELKGVNYKHYMNQQTAEKIFKGYNWVYRTGKPYKAYDIEMIRKDGSVCYVDASVYLRRDSEGNPIGFKGMVKDVTERKQAEQEKENLEAQLRQSQKMEAIGTLAGGIAHDFNNILSSVIGYTELSLEEAEDGSTLHRNLSQVLTAGNRAKALVRQILALSRKEEQEVKPTPVVPLVKEALKMLRSTIPSSIEVRENISSGQLIVNADPTQLHQVIVNLATNASQAMAEESGVLEVAVESVSFDKESIRQKYSDMRPGNYVRITVSDTGVGISEQYLDKIFEPYFTTKEKGTGTGLGLSIVHGIVKRHSGHISVYSEPGRGTVFHVYLPLAARDTAADQVQEQGPLPAGNESILLVDDEQPIVEMQQIMLESLGYRVAARTSAVEALEAFRSNPDKFDILITDMAMSNMNGDKLAAAVKEIRPDIPVILCTGFSQELNVFKDSPAIDQILMKPVGKAEIARVVRKVLENV